MNPTCMTCRWFVFEPFLKERPVTGGCYVEPPNAMGRPWTQSDQFCSRHQSKPPEPTVTK